ncbi:uncharacterized protein [Dermacentor andersoni]|uniref:uncharacterized protein n=1 Tax=Dermacentor andersoni TaxID=34620 RepID=UPI003B3BA92D
MTDVPPPLPPRLGAGLQAASQSAVPDHLNATLPRSSSCSDVDDMDSNGGYTEVTNRRLKRKLRRTSSVSELNYNKPPTRQAYTIACIPVVATRNLNSLNRQTLTAYLERLAPGQIGEVRINPRRNILTVDVTTRTILDTLKGVTELGNILVRSFIVHGGSTTAGVIYDVDTDIDNGDLPTLISSTVHITDIHRLGRSRCTKLMFEGETLPTHVKVGYVRHPVRPYIPRPLQCRKCQKIGHVSAVCVNKMTCPRCGGDHDELMCAGSDLKCPNCNGLHEATSRDCPKLKTEMSVLRKMIRDRSTHREGATKVHRRQRCSHNRRRLSASTTGQPVLQEKPSRAPASPQTSEPPLTTSALLNTKDTTIWPSLPSRSTEVQLERQREHEPSSSVGKSRQCLHS